MKQVFVWALILGLQQLFCEWRWQSATRKKKYLWQCFSVFLQFAIILISFQFIDEKMAFFQHFSNGRKTKLGNTLEHVRKFDDLIKCWLRGDQKNVWLLFCFYQDSRYRDKQVIERLRSAELTCSVMFSQLLPNLHFIPNPIEQSIYFGEYMKSIKLFPFLNSSFRHISWFVVRDSDRVACWKAFIADRKLKFCAKWILALI